MSLGNFQPIYLTLAEHDDIVVASVNLAQMNDEDNTEQLGRELSALIDQYQFRKVVLNLQLVEYTTSSVLGKIISMHRKLHRSDGMLVVCGIGGTLRDVMRTSRLLDYFNVTADVDSAIEMLS